MRIGLVLPDGAEVPAARLAEAHGLFGVLVRPDRPGTEMTRAAEVAVATRDTRVIGWLPLGSEHPVTLAEEAAVLDNIAAGRVMLVADTGDLDAGAAGEDLLLLRRCWSGRPIRHQGPRWRVPAGRHDDVPAAISVTPKPAQVDIPVWLAGPAATDVAGSTGLARLVNEPGEVDRDALIAPGIAELSGDLAADRELVTRWAAAGATHLLLRPAPAADLSAQLAEISRYLLPEVGTPLFPRIVAESPMPLPWPESPQPGSR
jgi:hypothetical protein